MIDQQSDQQCDQLWDQRFMAAAGRFARRHLGETAENPSVGALIVRFDGDAPIIVGRGVTAKGGRPHAEVQALNEADSLAKGATVYVTLEPCSHFGKTPPCAQALIEAGVARVVIAIKDPDERVSGNGIAMLREAGIQVDMIAPDKALLNGLSAYLTRKTKKRPHVTLKLALSKDNAIGRNGEGFVPISSALSRERAHVMRMEHDAILIGIGTALADDPVLNCRLPGLEQRSPIRIVIDKALKLPLASKLVQTAKLYPLWIVCDQDADSKQKRQLEEYGCRLLEFSNSGDQIRLTELLECLAKNGVSSVLIEGGRETAQEFYDHGLCDIIVLFHSQTLIGDKALKAPIFHDLEMAYSIDEINKYQDDQCVIWRRK